MDSPDDLICLSYGSRATFGHEPGTVGIHPEVNRILVVSRRNNRERQIGGVLHYGNGFFFQYLEGPADTVDALYARICRDERHADVERLTRRPIVNRRFDDWSMKFVAIEQVVDAVLRRHDLARFDPYSFTPAIVDDLVVSCIHPPDDAPDLDGGAPGERRRSGKSFWRRLLGG